jgi:hypothetical protein
LAGITRAEAVEVVPALEQGLEQLAVELAGIRAGVR